MASKVEPEEWTRKALLRALEDLPKETDPVLHQCWVDWVRDYHIGRKSKVESALTIYNRIQQPSWLLWLAEAVGVDQQLIQKANQVVPQKQKQSQTTRMRKFLPWARIAELLPLASDLNRKNSGNSKPGRMTAGAPSRSYVRYVEVYEIEIPPAHNQLQKRFERFIRREATRIRPNENSVDLRYEDPTKGEVLVEVKPCEGANARYAIRTAIGQLLDYSQRVNRPVSLLIVVETKPRASDRSLATSNGFGIAYPANGSFEVVWPT